MKIILILVIMLVLVLTLIYLLLIMPRIWNRPDTSAFEGYLFAHRGLHDNAGDAPENSMTAFRKAVEAGYGIELDIQLSKDQIPVVFHDGTLDRVCGVPGNVSDYTFQELQQFRLCKSQERIPRFTEVLERVSGRVPLIVEFKGETSDVGLCPVADEILQRYTGPYCMESFNPLMVAWYRKHRGEVLRGQLSEKLYTEGTKKSMLNFALENLLMNCYARPDFIAYNHKHYDNLSRRIVTGFYKNIPVAYTIRTQAEYEEAQKRFHWIIFDSFIPV